MSQPSWQRAASFAARQHHGQFRKDGATPYVAHPVRVALTVRHLFGVDDPATIFLFGTDGFGRDVFSRLLFGGQISLVAGLLAAGVAVTLGLVLGGVGGFYGGWVDDGLMRMAELFLALPWLYLLLAVRSALPLQIDPGRALLLLVAVIGLVGWAIWYIAQS